MKNILITGGAGFIGSHVANYFNKKYPDYNILVLDLLTYAANPDYLDSDIPLIQMDISLEGEINSVFSKHNITDVIHLAAESHVDNSIINPGAFIQTNIIGTYNLLELARKHWGNEPGHVFHHVSTDEVYGSLNFVDEAFTEKTAYDPRSPYSASKASSDHLVNSYFHTYNLPIKMTNCSNNYGPHQHGEKLIPKVISNILSGLPIPIYGKGENIRDWLWVGDHVKAIDLVFHKGELGETYNVGGDDEMSNIVLVKNIIGLMGADESLIEFVEDRKGHDLRYAIDSTKLSKLGWSPEVDFEAGILKTIEFYKESTSQT